MDADNLIPAILDIRTKLEKGLFVNEASISQGVVRRLLDALGWPQWETSVVAPEYSIGGLRVDFALCHPPDKPIAFVEVKQPGKADGTEVQLFQYAFHKGVPLAILTDGRTWQFFLPTELGEYAERRLHTLDLVERDPQECSQRFVRYLAYDAIRTGEALKAAHADYTAQSRARDAILALPKAWSRLVAEGDSLLLDLVSEAAEQISGLKPSPEQTAAYLRGLSSTRPVLAATPPVTRPASSGESDGTAVDLRAGAGPSWRRDLDRIFRKGRFCLGVPAAGGQGWRLPGAFRRTVPPRSETTVFGS